MSMRNFQSQEVKERWKDIQDNIKKLIWGQKRMLVIESEIKMYSQAQDNEEYIKLELNFIEMMTRQKQKKEQEFMLFEELFLHDINIQTLCKGDNHDSRAGGHPQHRGWYPGEGENAANTPVIRKRQTTSCKMKFDEVYNRRSWATHE